MFDRYGRVREAVVIYDRVNGDSRGFGFVYYDTVEEAREAREKCNGQMVDGRRVRVDYSATQRPHTPTPGMYMGKPTYR